MLNDPFINMQEIENELQNMQQIAKTLDMQFPLLSQQVAYIFSKIKDCKTMQEANDYFEYLDKIQGELACLLYKYNIGMPDRLMRFVHDFDNLETICREHYFKKIISGEYSF